MNLLYHYLSSISPLLFMFLGFIYTYITTDSFGIYFSLINILFGHFANSFIKYIFKSNYPDSDWMKRPDPSAPCSYFLNHNKAGINWGFPSGHAQTVFIGIVLLIYYVNNKNIIFKNYISLLLILFGIYVCYSRVCLKCHNSIQVIVGSAIGIIFGIFSVYLWKYIKYNI